MLTCRECKEMLYPEDPTIRQPRWIRGQIIPYGSPSTCDGFCDKPTYYRELEQREPQVIEHIHRTSNMDKKEFALLQQLSQQVKYLDKKVNELYEKKKGVTYEIKP